MGFIAHSRCMYRLGEELFQALKARINIAQGEALGNIYKNFSPERGGGFNNFMFKFALTELKLWLYITQGFALGYINSRFQRLDTG